MAHKITKESKYYHPTWPVYTCSECGNEYYMKFKDSDKCFSCRSDLHNEIDKKLKTKIRLTNNY